MSPSDREPPPDSPAETPLSAGEAVGLNLLDEARPELPELPEELDVLRARSSDRRRSMDQRLEAFEDVFDSQVGDTTLLRARNVEREAGLRQIFLKFEGGNPSGTQKDRIAFAQVKDALRRGFEGITVATCGNYGAAVAFAAWLAGLDCEILIPEEYHSGRLDEMVRHGARIVRTPGDYESAVAASRERAEAAELYDANPGGANTPLQLEAYAEIAYEIYDELRDAPAAVAVPVSNGTTLAGIHKGFVRLYRRGKTSRLPRFVAGSSPGKNPIVRSWLKGLPHCENLAPSQVRESRVNEPLINWHSSDGEEALAAVRGSGGWAASSSDRELLRLAAMTRRVEGLTALPASLAGLAALLDGHRRENLGADRYVAVLTGRR